MEIAIRQKVGNLTAMKKAVLASLWHVASSLKNECHQDCPPGPTSWCQYQCTKVDDSVTYKRGTGLPINIVVNDPKLIYRNLSADDLLEKCLHVKTQSQNEAFNKMIW